MFIIYSSIIYGQKTVVITSESLRFYTTELLVSFPDTLRIYNKKANLPKFTAYCEIIKKKRKLYYLACWSGKPALESPSILKGKFKIKFKKDQVTFKLGKTKNIYFMRTVNGQLMLIKKEENSVVIIDY